MSKYRFLFSRRFVQILILVLYIGANSYGWKMLTGTLSFSKIFDSIPLTDPFALLQMLVAGATLTTDVIIGALIIVLFYGMIGGRAFCSWVCPINLVSDLANWLRRKLYLDVAQREILMNRHLRYWVLVLTLVVSALMGVGAFEFVSPITILNRGIIFGMGMSMAVVIVIFFFDLFVLKNGWCGHICPLGALYSLIGQFAPLSVFHNQKNCTLCMNCRDICPENQVLHMIGKNSMKVLDLECTNCGRCIEVCKDNALKFTIFDLKNDI